VGLLRVPELPMLTSRWAFECGQASSVGYFDGHLEQMVSEQKVRMDEPTTAHVPLPHLSASFPIRCVPIHICSAVNQVHRLEDSDR
jgi:hypothetical protein